MVCTVDAQNGGEEYPRCVLEYGRPDDCSHAKNVTSREACEFWRKEYAISEQPAVVCESCGAIYWEPVSECDCQVGVPPKWRNVKVVG